jgi:hypothetical protein
MEVNKQIPISAFTDFKCNHSDPGESRICGNDVFFQAVSVKVYRGILSPKPLIAAEPVFVCCACGKPHSIR